MRIVLSEIWQRIFSEISLFPLQISLKRLVIKDIKDDKYRLLVNKEYNFCMDNKERIEKKARKIYDMVIANKKQKLTDNSCNFKLLEKAYMDYLRDN